VDDDEEEFNLKHNESTLKSHQRSLSVISIGDEPPPQHKVISCLNVKETLSKTQVVLTNFQLTLLH
jgi:hypothetical protein